MAVDIVARALASKISEAEGGASKASEAKEYTLNNLEGSSWFRLARVKDVEKLARSKLKIDNSGIKVELKKRSDFNVFDEKNSYEADFEGSLKEILDTKYYGKDFYLTDGTDFVKADWVDGITGTDFIEYTPEDKYARWNDIPFGGYFWTFSDYSWYAWIDPNTGEKYLTALESLQFRSITTTPGQQIQIAENEFFINTSHWDSWVEHPFELVLMYTNENNDKEIYPVDAPLLIDADSGSRWRLALKITDQAWLDQQPGMFNLCDLGLTADDVVVKLNLNTSQVVQHIQFANTPAWTMENAPKITNDFITEPRTINNLIEWYLESTPVQFSYQEFEIGRRENGEAFFIPMVNTVNKLSLSSSSSSSDDSGESGSDGASSYAEEVDVVSEETDLISDEGDIEAISSDEFASSDSEAVATSDGGSGDNGSEGSSGSSWIGAHCVLFETYDNETYLDVMISYPQTKSYPTCFVNVELENAENFEFLEELEAVELDRPGTKTALEGTILEKDKTYTFIVSGNAQDYIDAISDNKEINITYIPTTIEGEDLEPITIVKYNENELLITGIDGNIAKLDEYPTEFLVWSDTFSSASNSSENLIKKGVWFRYNHPDYGYPVFVRITRTKGVFECETYDGVLFDPNVVIQGPGLTYEIVEHTGTYLKFNYEAEAPEGVSGYFYPKPENGIRHWGTIDLSATEFEIRIPYTPSTTQVFDRYIIDNNDAYNFHLKLEENLVRATTPRFDVVDVNEEIQQLNKNNSELGTRIAHVGDALEFVTNTWTKVTTEKYRGKEELVGITNCGETLYNYIVVNLHEPNVWTPLDVGVTRTHTGAIYGLEAQILVLEETGVDVVYIRYDGRQAIYNTQTGEFEAIDGHYPSEWWITYTRTDPELIQQIKGNIPINYYDPIASELQDSIQATRTELENLTGYLGLILLPPEARQQTIAELCGRETVWINRLINWRDMTSLPNTTWKMWFRYLYDTDNYQFKAYKIRSRDESQPSGWLIDTIVPGTTTLGELLENNYVYSIWDIIDIKTQLGNIESILDTLNGEAQ